jgi:hypothetical protein
LERSKSLVLLQVGGVTCRWQQHSVKPAENQLRVVVPIEEEEEEEVLLNFLSNVHIPWILITAKIIVQRKLSHFSPIGNHCSVHPNV